MPSFDSLIKKDLDVVVELSKLALLVFNIKKEVYLVLDSFFSFLKKNSEK